MLHVATVHWKSDRWVDLQLRYLQRFVPAEFRVYAFLDDLPGDHASKYHFAAADPAASHAVKLNLLADRILQEAASEDDWLVFVDGDAFPIADLVAYAAPKLRSYPLLAVQRLENNGDLQPHPCFCLTTVGFWRSIGGDWREGYAWRNLQGKPVTDVGGNLLGRLLETGTAWYPMKRTNRRDRIPVSFGIYDDAVYHHGAGFREGTTRVHILEVRRAFERRPWNRALLAAARGLSSLDRYKGLAAWAEGWTTERVRREARAEIREASLAVFESIEKDPEFFRQFQ
jgi:hypothetical protein